jgi:TatD DNase family protein
MFLVDTHCHLDLLDLDPYQGDLNLLLQKAEDNGVKHIVNVAVNIRDFPSVLKRAMEYPFVSASVGLHPNDQDEDVTKEQLIELGKHPKVIAIGETGLDYFRTTGDTQWQRNRFRDHIAAAKSLQKPLIIHTRQAREDTINVLREENASQVAGIMHCFTEDWETAKQALDMGFYISFSGIVTFKNAVDIQEVAKKVPLDRILVETDAPYLAPNPHRGKTNVPGYVRYTAEFIAAMRGVDFQQFAAQTTENFYTLFKGAARPHV